MNIDKFHLILIAVIIILVTIGIFNHPDKGSDAKVEIKHDLEDLKRIKNLERELVKRDTLWSHIRKHDKERFDSALRKSQKSIIVYRDFKPPIIKTDKELDSIITLILQP